jgi:F-type H+-transporting ATPase subunit a
LAIVVFVYSLATGVKTKGLGKAIKEVVPSGLPPRPMDPSKVKPGAGTAIKKVGMGIAGGFLRGFLFLLECISIILRPITHALRLFANMYAGHIMLGIFSIMTSLFFTAAIKGAWANLAVTPVWLILLIIMYTIETLVVVIQAYVFSLLSAVYIEESINSH